MKDLRVVFMGTPEFAVPVLKELIKNTNVLLVVSQPDALVGRKKVLTPSPVKKVAQAYNIDVLTPQKLKDEYDLILNYQPDIIITCAYGQIVPRKIIDYPSLGCINVHASLLPKYRGASPISEAIKNGEIKTGVTIMYMDYTLDTGNIINAKEIAILDEDTLGTLSDKLSKIGAQTLIETLPKIIDRTNFSLPQNEDEATYVSTIKRSDEVIDFNKPSKDVYNHIRSLNPKPLANTRINDLEWKIIDVKIGTKSTKEPGIITSISKDHFSISTMDNDIDVYKVKIAGKKEMKVIDLFNGLKKEELLGKKVGEV